MASNLTMLPAVTVPITGNLPMAFSRGECSKSDKFCTVNYERLMRQAGSYSVTVSNVYGVVATDGAKLTVLRSLVRFEPSMQFSGNGLALTLSGLSGDRNIIILSSTNMAAWQPILTNPPATGTMQLMVPIIPGCPAQFYQAVEE